MLTRLKIWWAVQQLQHSALIDQGLFEKLVFWRAEKPLVRLLSDRSHIIRLEAARALGRLHDPQAVDDLIKVLKDWHVMVRIAAVEALGAIGDSKAVLPLIGVLTDDDYIPTRGFAATALKSLGDSRAIEPLIAVLAGADPETPRASDKRGVFLDALANLGDARAIAPLLKLASDREIAAIVIRALSSIVERVAQRIPEPDLRRLADLRDPIQTNYEPVTREFPGGSSTEYEPTGHYSVDSRRLRELALSELKRRGNADGPHPAIPSTGCAGG